MIQRAFSVAPILAGLLLLQLQLPLAAQSRSQRLQELEQLLNDESQSWFELRERDRSPEEWAEIVASFPRDELVPELESIAQAEPGTDVGARAWLACLRIGAMLDERELYTRALERLVTDHVTSNRMAGLTLDLVYGAPSWSAEPAAAALRAILAKHPSENLQAAVMAELALLVGLDESFGAAGRAEAEALLARIEKELGAEEFMGMDGAEFAAGARHEIAHLRPGMPAPDFEVTDQEGVRFKLSDYRGRVVLLDFWGFV
jgi:hypothetical protein